MKSASNDPVFDEIRDARRAISARFNNDPVRLVEHYMKLQEQYQDRLVNNSENFKQPNPSAA